MKLAGRHILPACLIGLGLWLSPQSSYASFMDDDFYCSTYGCVVVHDANTFDVYDVYILSGGGTVPFGGQLIPWSGNPFQGAGSVDPVITDTLNGTTVPLAGQGNMLAISNNAGNGQPSIRIDDDGDGFLDASDSMEAFELRRQTNLRLDGQSYSHSFYISSLNTRFSLRARAEKDSGSLDFDNTIDMDDITLDVRIDGSGNDGGLTYGSAATTSGIRLLRDIDNLGDINGVSRSLVHFGRSQGIRRRSDSQQDDQSIRLDFEYGLPDYDMSMGVGDLKLTVYYEFFREQSSQP